MNLLQWFGSWTVNRQKTQGKPRSPKWAKMRAAWLSLHPYCRGCGITYSLEVHHKTPFWKDAALELAWNNLITLCEANGCHFRLGHCLLWKAWNENVEEDADLSRMSLQARRIA